MCKCICIYTNTREFCFDVTNKNFMVLVGGVIYTYINIYIYLRKIYNTYAYVYVFTHARRIWFCHDRPWVYGQQYRIRVCFSLLLARSLWQERSQQHDVTYSMWLFFYSFGSWHHRQKLYGACGRSDFGCLKRQQRAGWLCFQTLSRYSRHTLTPTHKLVHIHAHTYTLERATAMVNAVSLYTLNGSYIYLKWQPPTP